MQTPNREPLQVSAKTVVLPCRPRLRTFLDARAALELSVLGAASCRLAPLEGIVSQVRCVGGDGWRPSREMIQHTIQAAVRSGYLHETESWVRSIPFFYTLTPKGVSAFRQLMLLPLPDAEEPDGRAASEIKYRLLDLAFDKDRSAIAADLRRFYLDWRRGLTDSFDAIPPDRLVLRDAFLESLAKCDARLASLDSSPPR
jgi:hypothetical protein